MTQFMRIIPGQSKTGYTPPPRENANPQVGPLF